MIPETMRNIYMVLLDESNADLAKANEHIAELHTLLNNVTAFLNDHADYDLAHGDSAYKPCNEAARLLQEIEAVLR